MSVCLLWLTEENHDHDLRHDPSSHRGRLAGELRAWSQLNVSPHIIYLLPFWMSVSEIIRFVMNKFFVCVCVRVFLQ